MHKSLLTFLTVPALVLASSCGSGTEQTAVIDEEERQIGQEQHQVVLREMGGAYRGPEAAYLAQLGEKVAAAVGLEEECTFTLVNAEVVNALAVPGCYIYVTRGLVAIVENEAELASVLGHELGHIVADHSEDQQQRSFLRELGVFAVALFTESEVLTHIAGGAADLFTLRYSRTHEYEADEFAIEALVQAGYDPTAVADMLASLAQHEQLQDERAPGIYVVPEWSRTHPLTENRIERVRAAAERAEAAAPALPES